VTKYRFHRRFIQIQIVQKRWRTTVQLSNPLIMHEHNYKNTYCSILCYRPSQWRHDRTKGNCTHRCQKRSREIF